MKRLAINEAEIQRLEDEIGGNEKKIAQFESELMSPDSNSEGIQERESELIAKNVRLRRELAMLKDPRTPDGNA